uniref:Uncharacterized protein n=1 Tax=Strongyloides venezuelensis TaxID=75913 RepID=A0A0K0G1B9_STRVS
MLNCTSIESRKKENNEHLKNASFFKEIQCNSLANESKKFKSSKKKETCLRAYTYDYFVSADGKIIDAFEKYNYDYIVSACFHIFESKSNTGASFTILGTDFVFTSSCRLKEDTTDNYITAKDYLCFGRYLCRLVIADLPVTKTVHIVIWLTTLNKTTLMRIGLVDKIKIKLKLLFKHY